MIFFRYGLHDQFLFLMAERIELAIGSQAEQRRRACRDLAVDLVLQLLYIDGFVLMQGRNHCRNNSL